MPIALPGFIVSASALASACRRHGMDHFALLALLEVHRSGSDRCDAVRRGFGKDYKNISIDYVDGEEFAIPDRLPRCFVPAPSPPWTKMPRKLYIGRNLPKTTAVSAASFRLR